MTTSPEDGALVLADISGFTEFVTATELEHGPPIVAELLSEVIRHLAPPLEIQEVEGDAVFALGPDGDVVPERLPDVLGRAYAAFRTRRHEMQANETCACNACANIGRLDLKIVAHHGRFLRQSVGGRAQVAGTDVILAHRLLKNGVTRTPAYLLVTDAALRWMRLDPLRDGLVAHRERYEHLGDVTMFVRDLAAREPAVPAHAASAA
jgi:hypothetical protein